MTIPTSFNFPLYVNDELGCRQFNPPAGCITDAAIQSAAGISRTKVIAQRALEYAQAPGTAVVAATVDLHLVYGTTGGVVALQAAISGVIATGADRTVTLDLYRSTAGGAFVTMLSAPIVLDNANTLRVLESATIAAATLVAGDVLRLLVTVAGAAGNQAQGLCATVTYYEAPL